MSNRGNGLLNALSTSSRASAGPRVSSPGGMWSKSIAMSSADYWATGTSSLRSPIEAPRQGPDGLLEGESRVRNSTFTSPARC